MSAGENADSYQLVAEQVYATTILGPPFLGWLLAIMLFGTVLGSYFRYIHTDLYRNDPSWTKAILHAAMILATTQTGCTFWLAWHYAISQQRDSTTLFAQTSIDCFELTFVGLEGALVQLYLARRATLFMRRSKWRFLYWALVIVGVLSGLAGALLYMAASFMLRRGVDIGLFNWAVGTWLWGCTWADCLIAGTLVISLRKKMVHFSSRTDSILAQLINLTVQSALPTALLSLVGAILAYAFSVESLFANVTGATWSPLTGLYMLSLLATLGGRRKVREAASKTVSWHFNPNEIATADFGERLPGHLGWAGAGTPIATPRSGRLVLHEGGVRPVVVALGLSGLGGGMHGDLESGVASKDDERLD